MVRGLGIEAAGETMSAYWQAAQQDIMGEQEAGVGLGLGTGGGSGAEDVGTKGASHRGAAQQRAEPG